MRRVPVEVRVVRTVRYLVVATLLGAVGCGERKSDGASSGGAVGSGGDGGSSAGGTAASAGSAIAGNDSGGKAGGDAGATASGGKAGLAGGGSGAGNTLVMQPACAATQSACNGSCLAPGQSAQGCTHLTAIQSIKKLAAQDGNVYFSGQFPLTLGDATPAPGLYRIDGKTLELTALDTMNASSASTLAVDASTVYYAVGTSDAMTLRSVASTGGTPQELASGLKDVVDLLPVGDRLFFGAGSSTLGDLGGLSWIAKAGGELHATGLESVSRARANGDLIAVSWNGDIRTAPLPDATAEQELFGDFALPEYDWWIDDHYVYWLKNGSYKRILLNATGATEAGGEVVTTLPDGMTVVADANGELLLTVSQGNTRGFYVMPVAGGTPKLVGTTGPGTGVGLDASFVYVSAGLALLRLER
jgi:hypothetical protein